MPFTCNAETVHKALEDKGQTALKVGEIERRNCHLPIYMRVMGYPEAPVFNRLQLVRFLHAGTRDPLMWGGKGLRLHLLAIAFVAASLRLGVIIWIPWCAIAKDLRKRIAAFVSKPGS